MLWVYKELGKFQLSQFDRGGLRIEILFVPENKENYLGTEKEQGTLDRVGACTQEQVDAKYRIFWTI